MKAAVSAKCVLALMCGILLGGLASANAMEDSSKVVKCEWNDNCKCAVDESGGKTLLSCTNKDARDILVLRYEHLTSIRPGAFDETPSVRTIYLDVNNLTADSIPPDAFEMITHLQILDLSSNEFQTLPRKIVSNNYMLADFIIDDNDIEFLPEGIFDHVNSKTKIELLKNPGAKKENCPEGTTYEQIYEGSRFYFCMKKTVSDQKVEKCGEETECLCDSDIGRKKLVACPHGSKEYRTMALQGLHIYEIEEEAFRPMNPKNTVHIDLNYNALESFPEKVFTQDGVKHKIVRIDLSLNALTSLHKDQFKGVKELKTLNLSFNALEYLPEGLFDDHGKLETLDLYGNPGAYSTNCPKGAKFKELAGHMFCVQPKKDEKEY